MGHQARQVLANLRSRFQIRGEMVSDRLAWHGACPIGMEVEVKWRDYFPDLWEKYLKGRNFSDLTVGEKAVLSTKCTLLERSLLPRLQATVDCGVKKGADRYWEFAFRPATDVLVLADQIDVLQRAKLIPEGDHILHMTIGNLRPTRDSYYLLLMLEMHACDADRIGDGFHEISPKLSATWARKGMGGLFAKDAADLECGTTRAVELRTLVLNEQTDVHGLMRMASVSADAIYCKEQGLMTPAVEAWDRFVAGAAAALKEHNLADVNWKKQNLAPESWSRYIACFPRLKKQVREIYVEHLKLLVDLRMMSETVFCENDQDDRDVLCASMAPA